MRQGIKKNHFQTHRERKKNDTRFLHRLHRKIVYIQSGCCCTRRHFFRGCFSYMYELLCDVLIIVNIICKLKIICVF